MTEETKEYKEALIENCKTYCHIDYDDDEEVVKIMVDAALEEMTELIPDFDVYAMTSRQKLLVFITVKELYDNREKYEKDQTTLSRAASSMLLKEIYGGGAG